MSTKTFQTALFITLITLLPQLLFSQYQYKVSLTHTVRNKVHYMEEGKKIKVWLQNDNKTYKGHLHIVNDSTISINDYPLSLNEIVKLRGKTTATKIMNILGITITVSGSAFALLGTSIAIEGAKDESCAAPFVVLVGTALAITGASAAVIGALAMLIHGKKYNIPERWTIDVVQTQ